jgi:hypothetical protein
MPRAHTKMLVHGRERRITENHTTASLRSVHFNAVHSKLVLAANITGWFPGTSTAPPSASEESAESNGDKQCRHQAGAHAGRATRFTRTRGSRRDLRRRGLCLDGFRKRHAGGTPLAHQRCFPSRQGLRCGKDDCFRSRSDRSHGSSRGHNRSHCSAGIGFDRLGYHRPPNKYAVDAVDVSAGVPANQWLAFGRHLKKPPRDPRRHPDSQKKPFYQ